MVTVRPFKGLRPKKEIAPALASLPYDVMDSDEARAEVKKNPQSFMHVTKSEVDLDRSIDPYDPKVYQKAGENLQKLIKDGTMRPDKTPNFYFYRQIMGKHAQVGLVATVSAEEYEAGLIKKHEFTRPEKEQDRVNHILGTKAQCGPVFLVYHDIEELNEIQETVCAGKPENDFTSDDGIKHTVWPVSDPKVVKRIEAIFNKTPALYVADGHHRSAAGTIVKNKQKAANKKHTGKEEYNFFLAVIFPKTHMQIMPYNRAVQDLNGRNMESFLEAIEEKFTFTPGADPSPDGLHKYSMYLGGKWYGLKPKPGSYPANDPVKSLDASILQDNLLAPILGIENPRTDKRIKFIGGIRGTKELEKLVDSGKFAVAFSLYPVKMDQIISVADSGNVMPPKSTWFEPKLRSGLIVHQI